MERPEPKYKVSGRTERILRGATLSHLLQPTQVQIKWQQ